MKKDKKEEARERISHSNCFWSVKSEIAKEIERFGFLLAFRNKDKSKPIGFSLIVSKNQRIAVIHGAAERVGGEFTITTSHQGRYDADGTFTMVYLEEFAKMVGVDTSALLSKLSARQFLWRFIGYVDGVLSHDQDNDDVWQSLWRMLKALDSRRPQIKRVPIWASTILFDGLKHASVEGQIVLDK